MPYEDDIRQYFATLPPILSRDKALEVLGGISISQYYVLAGEKLIRLRKLGGKTVAETASLLEYLLSLEEAEIASDQQKRERWDRRRARELEAVE